MQAHDFLIFYGEIAETEVAESAFQLQLQKWPVVFHSHKNR